MGKIIKISERRSSSCPFDRIVFEEKVDEILRGLRCPAGKIHLFDQFVSLDDFSALEIVRWYLRLTIGEINDKGSLRSWLEAGLEEIDSLATMADMCLVIACFSADRFFVDFGKKCYANLSAQKPDLEMYKILKDQFSLLVEKTSLF